MITGKGNPVADGRYVAFVPCLQRAPNGHYVEPIIAVWSGGKWHKGDPRAPVGFMGPLPVMLLSEFSAPAEYDL